MQGADGNREGTDLADGSFAEQDQLDAAAGFGSVGVRHRG